MVIYKFSEIKYLEFDKIDMKLTLKKKHLFGTNNISYN